MTKSTVKKSSTGSLPPAVPLAITPTFSPWTHTSDDSYIYQLSLVLATATVSFCRTHRSAGYGYEFLTEYTEVSGTVWMLYRTHKSIGHGHTMW